MTPRANIIWWVLFLGLSIALACVVMAQPRTLVLGWNWSGNSSNNSADSFRVYCGTNSRAYDTNWVTATNSTAYELTDVGRYWFAVRAERNFGHPTNSAVSAMSDEVMFEYMPPPVMDGVMSVRLTTILETSEDLRNWRGMTSAPTWLIATGMAGFFRNPKLQIEKQKTVTP